MSIRRALLMATGGTRGAYYAGFHKPLQAAGIAFELLSGVSAGAIAAAWMASGDGNAWVDSWRVASRWRVALHPFFAHGRHQTSDRLLQSITLKMMNLTAVREAESEVKIFVARIRKHGLLIPKVEPFLFSSRDATDDDHLAQMLRATSFVPLYNGIRASVQIGPDSFLDGGMVNRVPLTIIPQDRFDEIWIAACSPSGTRELIECCTKSTRPERFVIITPSRPLPVSRWTLAWDPVQRAMEIGEHDMATAIRQSSLNADRVVIGQPQIQHALGYQRGPGMVASS